VDLPIDEHERRVIEGANHVFIHSPGMMEKKGGLNPRTTYVPNGVDVTLYSRDFAKPADLDDVDGPIVMYIGVLKSMLDWNLLQALCVKMPQISFVFVGPMGTVDEADRNIMAAMSDRANVRFIGSREIYELPAYASHASICIMPYRANGYTKYIFPIKVNEYLAAGKPTIGTSIRTLQDYSDVIALADDVDEWTDAIHEALKDSPADLNAAKRVEYASRFDWDKIVRLIADRINGEYGS
jgi:glycosyltransferase involved in cell wall biosynthesis